MMPSLLGIVIITPPSLLVNRFAKKTWRTRKQRTPARGRGIVKRQKMFRKIAKECLSVNPQSAFGFHVSPSARSAMGGPHRGRAKGPLRPGAGKARLTAGDHRPLSKGALALRGTKILRQAETLGQRPGVLFMLASLVVPDILPISLQSN